MNTSAKPRPYTPHRAIAALMRRHGSWVILRAVVSELLRRKRCPVSVNALSDHLRRDIGVGPAAPPPPLRPPPF